MKKHYTELHGDVSDIINKIYIYRFSLSHSVCFPLWSSVKKYYTEFHGDDTEIHGENKKSMFIVFL